MQVYEMSASAGHYRLDHPTYEDVYQINWASGAIYDWHRTKSSPVEVNSLVKIKIAGTEYAEEIPLFYRPKEGYWDDATIKASAFNAEGGYYEKAWMSFRGDDAVVVAMDKEDKPSRVVGFIDNYPRVGENIFMFSCAAGHYIRTCIDDQMPGTNRYSELNYSSSDLPCKYIVYKCNLVSTENLDGFIATSAVVDSMSAITMPVGPDGVSLGLSANFAECIYDETFDLHAGDTFVAYLGCVDGGPPHSGTGFLYTYASYDLLWKEHLFSVGPFVYVLQTLVLDVDCTESIPTMDEWTESGYHGWLSSGYYPYGAGWNSQYVPDQFIPTTPYTASNQYEAWNFKRRIALDAYLYRGLYTLQLVDEIKSVVSGQAQNAANNISQHYTILTTAYGTPSKKYNVNTWAGNYSAVGGLTNVPLDEWNVDYEPWEWMNFFDDLPAPPNKYLVDNCVDFCTSGAVLVRPHTMAELKAAGFVKDDGTLYDEGAPE